jgi:N utilization substance protein B
MGSRRKAREMALSAVFAHEFSGQALDVATGRILDEETPSEDIAEFFRKLLMTYAEHRAHIDDLIVQHSNNWKLTRMASVDRNLLRLGASEILYLPDIPKSVTINEYLEIAKKYGTEESSSFINGILDKLDKPV